MHPKKDKFILNVQFMRQGTEMTQELQRELGLKEVVATVVTAVIGGGLFLSTIQIQSKVAVGSSIIFSYMIAALPAFLMALCYAVLSSALPSSGGEYVFVSRIVDPFIGFITTWARWFAMIATIAAMAVGDMVLINNFFDILNMHAVSGFIADNITAISIILVVIFLMINYVGVKTFGRIQVVMFVLLMIGISAFILFGISEVDMGNLTHSMDYNLSDIAKASSLIFFSYLGFAAIANVGGEIKKPEKTLPKGIIISMIMISVIYILVALITYGSMSPSFYSSYDFSNGSVPDVSSHFLPSFIAVLVAFAGSIAIISDINPNILASSRLSFAWAKDNIVPQKIAELNKYGVPKWTLLINGVMAISIILLAKQFMNAVIMINMAILLIYIAISTSALILPYKHPEIYAKAKLKFRGMWIVALLGMLTSALFFGYILRLDGAMPGFILLLVWTGIGSVVYVLTLEHHQMHWRLFKEEKKGKEITDEETIKEMVGEDNKTE